MRIAAARVAPTVRTVPDTLRFARTLLGRAAEAGAGLLVLPQRFAAAGVPDPEEAAEASDGPTARAMREAAGGTGVAVAYGYLERCSGSLYDSLLLIDRSACCIANYRRTHHAPPPAEGEAGALSPGHWLSAMPLGGRCVGLLSGYDLAFPEAARALRLAGCDLLLVAGGARMPAATGALLRARAAENGCPVAFASASPDDPAAVIGPGGDALAEGDLAVADLGPAPAEADAAILADRRPRLYRGLAVEPEGADTR